MMRAEVHFRHKTLLKTETRMEVSALINMFFRHFWLTWKSVSLCNNTGTDRVGEFGGILWKTSVYPKFVHIFDALMGIVSKDLRDKLIRDVVFHAVVT